MLFLVAVLIGFGGAALLVLGEVTWRGRKVPARASRQIGGVLAGLLPAYFLVRIVMDWIDYESGDYAVLAFCIVTAIDLAIAGYLLRRATGPAMGVIVPRRTGAARPTLSAPAPPIAQEAPAPIAAPSWIENTPETPAPKRSSAPAARNPFDFS